MGERVEGAKRAPGGGDPVPPFLRHELVCKMSEVALGALLLAEEKDGG
jgi:hypothetical protein